MRSMPLRSAAAVLALTLTFAFAAPTTHARPVQPRESVATSGEPRGVDRVARVVRRLLHRLTGGVSTNNWPTVPIPAPTTTP
jgi:hypothetical protein